VHVVCVYVYVCAGAHECIAQGVRCINERYNDISNSIKTNNFEMHITFDQPSDIPAGTSIEK